ncbi:MAG: phosphoenolpyruvate--protein phosphotransferase [Alphaproteobacteria bacterium]|nr:phosphoenolpyruvate--protein phosphotransferase [Alphaproteobacteria bacterium]
MAAGGAAQARLDALVRMIAAAMVADVCSIYLKRGDVHELFATEGLKPEAVHRTRLKAGEGLVGLVGETARPLNLADAPVHPRFSYRPETGEDPYNAFLGVPIVRSERVFGVLVVQNRVAKLYGDDEVEALQTVAMVLAEMVAAGGFGDLSGLADVEIRPSRPERLQGRAFSDGLAIGTVVLHEPHAPLGRMIADDPVREEKRLEEALQHIRADLQAMIDGDPGRLSGVSRDVLETFALLAQDRSWEGRLRDGVRAGLSAEAAVERARQEHRAKMQGARDPYLRERLHDLEDLDNRLLRALGKAEKLGAQPMPDDAILVARDLGPAELLEYAPGRLRGLALEEGGQSSHAAIVARALGIPMVGRIQSLVSRVEPGDRIVVDAERAEVQLRPGVDIVRAYDQRIALRSARAQEFARLRDQPAETRDGRPVSLLLNAGLTLDVQHLGETGAAGVGLFRTEFQFMVSETLPRLEAQTRLYRDVLEQAGDKPVTFRTLDLGGDKVLPYMVAEREENPALGWRALRIGLDRPALLRYQLRALIAAAEGRGLRVMFPLVTTVEEFDAAAALVQREMAWARKQGAQGPARLEIGVMLEAPALAFAIDALKGKAAFVSIGTNDLMQYFFAADRNNPRVGDRYDLLSVPALRFLREVRTACAAAGLPLSICGEAAGRPLEAMTLVALGFDRLSMPASGIGPVKRMIRSLDAAHCARALEPLLQSTKNSLRTELSAYATANGVAL